MAYFQQRVPKNAPSIFGTEAPRYYEAGVSVIPLKWQSKAPFLEDWARYKTELPPEDIRNTWIQNYAWGNIGLVTGQQSGMSVIDIDAEDEKVIEIICSVLPDSPWKRVGSKGMVFAYKYDSRIRNFNLRADINGNGNREMVAEYLSDGRQVVLPPSIHPDTQKPYQANAHLLDVRHILPKLPVDIEDQLRQALINAGYDLNVHGGVKYTTFVSEGQRDTSMVGLAGGYARDILRAQVTVQQAVDQMYAWAENQTEQVAGDSLDPNKAVNKVLEFLIRDMYRTGRALPLGWDEGINDEIRSYMEEHLDEDSEEWTSEQIKAYAREELYKLGRGNETKKLEMLKKIVVKVARNSSFGETERDYLYKYLSDTACVSGVTAASLKRQGKEVASIELPGTDHTQVAQHALERLSEEGELRHHESIFWQWRGSHWEEKPDYELLRFIATEYGDLPALRKSHDHSGVLRVMASLVEKPLQTRNISGINFANGYLTSDLQLVVHDKAYGARYTLPYRYMPELAGHCPKMMEMLYDFWGQDPDFETKKAALQQSFAATLFGVAHVYQRAFLLFGVPSTGKTRILKLIEGLMPDEVRSSVPPEQWSDKFLPTEMAGKLLNVCGEIHEHHKISGKHFKTIVEGTEISGQYKGKQIFKFKPTCAHWFAGNHLPKTRDSSAGFNRRFLIFEFTRSIPDEKKNPLIIEEMLSAEIEAITAWAVLGIKALHKLRDYFIPMSHTTLVNEMAVQNNTVRFFFHECENLRFPKVPEAARRTMTPEEAAAIDEKMSQRLEKLNGKRYGFHISEDDLYQEYNSFCANQGGVKPVGLREFRNRVREVKEEFGITLQVSSNQSTGIASIYHYSGIDIAPPSEQL